MTSHEDLRYPIGPFEPPDPVTPAQVASWTADIAQLPRDLRAVVAGLTSRQLDTPYRPGGWSVRQVVHHVPDSHLNSLLRFKWALTEDRPVIKPYDEQRWATLPDYRTVPIAHSLDLLDALHVRWVGLLQSLSQTDFQRAFVHPDTGAATTLAVAVGAYAWHGRHHTAHIERLIVREGWDAAGHP
ncbi:MAG: putative metal-dependent hydrolase [Acidobacteria bacterium]|nr:putative metal-dependent hydrolase [Acidobacteriota bacterium]